MCVVLVGSVLGWGAVLRLSSACSQHRTGFYYYQFFSLFGLSRQRINSLQRNWIHCQSFYCFCGYCQPASDKAEHGPYLSCGLKNYLTNQFFPPFSWHRWILSFIKVPLYFLFHYPCCWPLVVTEIRKLTYVLMFYQPLRLLFARHMTSIISLSKKPQTLKQTY